jgi:hypothetical protein
MLHGGVWHVLARKYNVPPSNDADEPRRYDVFLSEPAEIDIDQAHFRLSELVSQDYADRWQDGLLAEISRLEYFPYRWSIAPENEAYDVDVRRLLYFGPSRRSGRTAYRVLFHIVEPPAGEQVGIVRVLHVWHGAKGPHV